MTEIARTSRITTRTPKLASPMCFPCTIGHVEIFKTSTLFFFFFAWSSPKICFQLLLAGTNIVTMMNHLTNVDRTRMPSFAYGKAFYRSITYQSMRTLTSQCNVVLNLLWLRPPTSLLLVGLLWFRTRVAAMVPSRSPQARPQTWTGATRTRSKRCRRDHSCTPGPAGRPNPRSGSSL